ncbi:hypothetical protein QO001_001457 [Methylobacterium brachiatum]|uniref:DUF4334 domain-containing protein n=1 Tax=Methylobacterium brachiatum TaxID=269660 RepID=A0AAJ1TPA1_9HYPH|nr:DUF4334 domain-containing protein [Methylobacterium brachiatum]MCB4802196.1 DUF4334 domain-containing protein [Methylobacterium brachiatum]MDQ0542539.1 hypothetical protein [Methylobacterium brachiatum]
MTFEDAIKAGKATPEEAGAIFDALDPITTDFMLGTWKGEGFNTGHPSDGMLESSGWYGKSFESVDAANPLLFKQAGTGEIFPVDPVKSKAAATKGKSIVEHRSDFEADGPKARLRMVKYRGVVTAGIIYNELPIIDQFRKVDASTLLGAMDAVGDPGTFFFVLRRAG